MGLWDINNAYFKYSIWASGIATNFTKMEVRGTLRVNQEILVFIMLEVIIHTTNTIVSPDKIGTKQWENLKMYRSFPLIFIFFLKMFKFSSEIFKTMRVLSSFHSNVCFTFSLEK